MYTSADPTSKTQIYEEISQGNEEVYFKAMSNLQLLKIWRLLPLHLELAVRRLKWLRSTVSQPSANEQFAAAVFGCIEVNGANWSRCIRSLKDDGSINRAKANSHLLKFEEALLTYEGISGTEDLFCTLRPLPEKLACASPLEALANSAVCTGPSYPLRCLRARIAGRCHQGPPC